MTEYICSVCKYNTSRKDLITKHINKKKPCKPSYIVEGNTDVQYKLEKPSIIEIPISYTCKKCSEKFTSKINFYKHKEECKHELKPPDIEEKTKISIEEELEQAYDKIEKLENEIEELKRTKNYTNSINTTNNINIYVMSNEKNSMKNVMKTIPLLLSELGNTRNNNKTYLIKDGNVIKDSLEIYDIDTEKLEKE